MSLFNLVVCPYCNEGDSNDWEVVGCVFSKGKESIQAQCKICKGVFEMVVSKRKEYDNYKKGTESETQRRTREYDEAREDV